MYLLCFRRISWTYMVTARPAYPTIKCLGSSQIGDETGSVWTRHYISSYIADEMTGCGRGIILRLRTVKHWVDLALCYRTKLLDMETYFIRNRGVDVSWTLGRKPYNNVVETHSVYWCVGNSFQINVVGTCLNVRQNVETCDRNALKTFKYRVSSKSASQ